MGKKFKPEPDIGITPYWIDWDLYLTRCRNARRELEEYRASGNLYQAKEEIEHLEENVRLWDSALADYVLKHRNVLMYAPEYWLSIVGSAGLDVIEPLIAEGHRKRQEEDMEHFEALAKTDGLPDSPHHIKGKKLLAQKGLLK